MSNKKTGKIVYYVIMAALILVFLVSAVLLLDYFIESWKSQQTYNELQNMVGSTQPTESKPMVPADPEVTEPFGETLPEATVSPLVTITDPETGEKVQILSKYAELYKLNPDLVGWMQIEGTRVNYPVVQRPETTDYYLYRDFYGNYDTHGCFYAREVCDVAAPSDNIIIYGHRMKDGTMMGDVGNYERKSYWEEHPYIRFDTLTEEHTYQIIFVFKTTASVGEGFQYHLFVDAYNETDFNSYIAGCRRNALYDTGLTAEYGDKLISLSTCEYSLENGRLVIVAKRID